MFRSIGLFIALSLAGLSHAVEVKPEINGTIDNGCLLNDDENACAFMGNGSTRTGAVPSNIYRPLIGTAQNTSYVTIQDLNVQHSAGFGFRTGQYNDHIVIKNNDFSFTGGGGIDVGFMDKQTFITGNSIFYTELCSYKNRGQSDHNAPKNCIGSFGASMELGGTGNHDAYTIAHNNDIAGTYGEALGSYGVDYTWTIGNKWRGSRSGPRLVDNSNHNVIESNISWAFDTSGLTSVIGTNSWSAPPDWNAAGVNITIEPRTFCPSSGNCPTNFNVVRNNIFATYNSETTALKANNKTNIGVPPNPNVNLTEELGVKVYGNTFIGSLQTALGTDEAYAKGEIDVVNNIVYATNSGKVCSSYGPAGYEKFRWRNNFYGVRPSDSDCVGTGDPTAGKPRLARDADTFGESNWTISRGPTIADVVVADQATGDDDGFDMNDETISWLNSADWDYFSEVTFPNGGGSLNGGNWAKALYYDFDGTVRSDTPNIGADETN